MYLTAVGLLFSVSLLLMTQYVQTHPAVTAISISSNIPVMTPSVVEGTFSLRVFDFWSAGSWVVVEILVELGDGRHSDGLWTVTVVVTVACRCCVVSTLCLVTEGKIVHVSCTAMVVVIVATGFGWQLQLIVDVVWSVTVVVRTIGVGLCVQLSNIVEVECSCSVVEHIVVVWSSLKSDLVHSFSSHNGIHTLQ